jgi:hypothetical protein
MDFATSGGVGENGEKAENKSTSTSKFDCHPAE